MARIERDQEENRRQTREIIAEIARMDAQRARDFMALAEALGKLNVRLARLEGN